LWEHRGAMVSAPSRGVGDTVRIEGGGKTMETRDSKCIDHTEEGGSRGSGRNQTILR